MLTTPAIGSLLVICGIVYMAAATILHGRMSDPHAKPGDTPTLEPRRRTLRFLGLKANWPALLMVIVGLVLLLVPPLLEEPPQVDTPAATGDRGAAS
jgi:hypothetical protein